MPADRTHHDASSTGTGVLGFEGEYLGAGVGPESHERPYAPSDNPIKQ